VSLNKIFTKTKEEAQACSFAPSEKEVVTYESNELWEELTGEEKHNSKNSKASQITSCFIHTIQKITAHRINVRS